jgi:DNA invertase Pin-like site-specific DNA recombinase
MTHPEVATNPTSPTSASRRSNGRSAPCEPPRSLADFAKLVELFDAHDVSFVSVTQQFNTATSMGRLILNVLLSFAQFEREVTSERIRDKIAASKRKGLWVGGPLPLGYELNDGKLIVVEEEAERVRMIFRRYLEVSGINELVRDLRTKNIRTKAKAFSSGKTRGGIPADWYHRDRHLGTMVAVKSFGLKRPRSRMLNGSLDN